LTSAHAQHAEPHADDCFCTPPPAEAAADSDQSAAVPHNGAGRHPILRGTAPGEADATADATSPSAVRRGLFEHAVCRVSGLPVESLEALRAGATAEAVDALADLEDELEALRPALTDALYAAVGGCEDKRLRSRLLAVRRDVHNLRSVAASRWAAVRSAVAPDLAAAVERYAELSHRRRRLREALPALHQREMEAARRGLQLAAADADFQCGLLLSSRVLFAGLERYRATPVADFTAKERQIERGVLRYLSRMAMKTTPFGTFTAVVPARFAACEGAGGNGGAGAGMPRFEGDPRTKRSLVRLNKRIYAVLRGEVLDDRQVRRHVAVELNPTLHLDGAAGTNGEGARGAVQRWRFLTSVDGKEVFQRLPSNAVLDLYQSLLVGGPRCLGELEEELLRQPAVEAPVEQVAAYTERLLEVGFLRFRLGVAPQEVDWDRPLLRLLEGVPGETAAQVAELVRVLRRQGDAFATAAVNERVRLLDAARDAMERACPALLQRAGLRTDLPFYEDAGADARLLLSRAETAALEDSLVHYVSYVRRLAWPRHEASVMRRFFAERYGEDAGPVPLLRFYEDYYRDHVHGEAAAGHDAADAAEVADGADDANGSAGNDLERRGRRAFRTLYRTLHERWSAEPEAPVLHLRRHDLESAFATMPPPAGDACSISLFSQVLPGEGEDGGPALLVSSLVGGFGKYFSRFLGLFPDDVYGDLRLRNAAAGNGALLAEIAADGDFNANLHPPLVPWEVDYPTAEGSGGEGRLSVDELVVEPHPRDPHALRLRRGADGSPVVPLDLGFLNPLWRPPLFRLLVQMAPAASFHLELPKRPQAAEGDAEEVAPRVVHRPRIVYDGRLVLARRRWEVPAELFPVRGGGETDDEYFLRADRWRRRCGLPREVFVSLYPFNRVERAAAGLDEAPPQAASRDDDLTQDPDGAAEPTTDGEPRRGHRHKPQYVDFANPLLVDLFGRLVEEDGHHDFHVYLYERLPASHHLPCGGDGGRHVTELVVEVDLPAGGAMPAPGPSPADGGDHA